MPRQTIRFHLECLFLCNIIPYKRKKYSEKVTVLLFRMIVHTNGEEGAKHGVCTSSFKVTLNTSFYIIKPYC